MLSIILRIAAGLLVLLFVGMAPLLFVLEEGWHKLVALPMIALAWTFAKYALGRQPTQEKLTVSSIVGVLLCSVGIILISYFGYVWVGRWFTISIVAVLMLVFALVFFIIERKKSRLVYHLRNCDKATQDSILATLDADDRREISKRLDEGDTKDVA